MWLSLTPLKNFFVFQSVLWILGFIFQLFDPCHKSTLIILNFIVLMFILFLTMLFYKLRNQRIYCVDNEDGFILHFGISKLNLSDINEEPFVTGLKLNFFHHSHLYLALRVKCNPSAVFLEKIDFESAKKYKFKRTSSHLYLLESHLSKKAFPNGLVSSIMKLKENSQANSLQSK